MKIAGVRRGERKRRGLAALEQLDLADEPTGNLDTVTGGVVEDILFSLNREHGITLIVVTHDEDLAARRDRRIHIRDGVILPEEVAA